MEEKKRKVYCVCVVVGVCTDWREKTLLPVSGESQVASSASAGRAREHRATKREYNMGIKGYW